jgi:hypothetical protein
MSKLFFDQLMERAGKESPNPGVLLHALHKALAYLHPSETEREEFDRGFWHSFEAHAGAPPRDGGEAYIYHPVRATFRAIWRMRKLGVLDVHKLIVILSHDCVEDARKAGFDPRLQLEMQVKTLGVLIAYDTLCITKHQTVDETSDEFFTRILTEGTWRSIAAKYEDREDNIDTIEFCSQERRIRKIKETEKWFPLLHRRLVELIEIEIQEDRLERVWRRMPDMLHRALVSAVATQKRRFKIH